MWRVRRRGRRRVTLQPNNTQTHQSRCRNRTASTRRMERLDRMLSLQQFGSARSFERFPVFPDDADFLSVESSELYRLSQKRILVVLIVCGKSVLMNNHHVSLDTARIYEVGQYALDLRCKRRLFFHQFFFRHVWHKCRYPFSPRGSHTTDQPVL